MPWSGGSLRELRFGGARQVTVPAGGEVVSDPVRLRVPPQADLDVSLYFPGRLTHVSQHWMALQTVYWTASGAGDHAADAGGAAYPVMTSSWPFVTEVDVVPEDAGGAVVAFGDSITDGAASTSDADRRWPDYLAARLQRCRRRPESSTPASAATGSPGGATAIPPHSTGWTVTYSAGRTPPR
ncbi:hypothetical protein GCM10029978_072800 [Actinoallomurus acanthiterrae]